MFPKSEQTRMTKTFWPHVCTSRVYYWYWFTVYLSTNSRQWWFIMSIKYSRTEWKQQKVKMSGFQFFSTLIWATLDQYSTITIDTFSFVDSEAPMSVNDWLPRGLQVRMIKKRTIKILRLFFLPTYLITVPATLFFTR